MLLDEPTVHLDLRHQVEAMELLADLNERDGTAIVAVLHDLGLAAHFFPRLVVIDHGRIVADGPPADVLDRRPHPRRVQRRARARPPRRDRGPRLARPRTPRIIGVMQIAEFELERFFARHEFAVRHLLCASDVEGWSMAELLALADDEAAPCGTA